MSLERVRGAAAASSADSPEQGGSSCKPSNRAGGLAYLEAQRKIGKHDYRGRRPTSFTFCFGASSRFLFLCSIRLLCEQGLNCI